MDDMQDVILTIYENALKKKIITSSIIAIVDFRKPSSKKRMFVRNMDTNKNLMEIYVTHGENSGGVYATNFSNTPESHKSSLGVFKTLGVYTGKHGRSLLLEGLEPGFNDNARARKIIIHSAPYIGNGKTGRSFGCFAVPPNDIAILIDLIKNGHLLISYFPESLWRYNSKFILG